MKLLITGGAGFIGSNFIRYIIKTHPDYKIICVDMLTYAGNINNLKGIIDNEKVKFIKENIVRHDSKYEADLLSQQPRHAYHLCQ